MKLHFFISRHETYISRREMSIPKREIPIPRREMKKWNSCFCFYDVC